MQPMPPLDPKAQYGPALERAARRTETSLQICHRRQEAQSSESAPLLLILLPSSPNSQAPLYDEQLSIILNQIHNPISVFWPARVVPRHEGHRSVKG